MIQRPKFRDDVVVRRMSNRHETYVIVKDPVELSYYKFEPWEEESPTTSRVPNASRVVQPPSVGYAFNNEPRRP